MKRKPTALAEVSAAVCDAGTGHRLVSRSACQTQNQAQGKGFRFEFSVSLALIETVFRRFLTYKIGIIKRTL